MIDFRYGDGCSHLALRPCFLQLPRYPNISLQDPAGAASKQEGQDWKAFLFLFLFAPLADAIFYCMPTSHPPPSYLVLTADPLTHSLIIAVFLLSPPLRLALQPYSSITHQCPTRHHHPQAEEACTCMHRQPMNWRLSGKQNALLFLSRALPTLSVTLLTALPYPTLPYPTQVASMNGRHDMDDVGQARRLQASKIV